MKSLVDVLLRLSLFALAFYSINAIRLEAFFKKNSTIQIQIFYILASMALAELVFNFLGGLHF